MAKRTFHELAILLMTATTLLGCGVTGPGGGTDGKPSCGKEPVLTQDESGPCAIPACEDLDDDEMLYEPSSIRPNDLPFPSRPAFSWRGCQEGETSCTPMDFTRHLGGNPWHDQCVERIRPPNMFPGSDVAVAGVCLDRGYPSPRNETGMPNHHVMEEVKTLSFGNEQKTGHRVCANERKWALSRVLGTVVKEAKRVIDCGYTYRLRVTNRRLEEVWNEQVFNHEIGDRIDLVDIRNGTPPTTTRKELYKMLNIDVDSAILKEHDKYVKAVRADVAMECVR